MANLVSNESGWLTVGDARLSLGLARPSVSDATFIQSSLYPTNRDISARNKSVVSSWEAAKGKTDRGIV